MYFATTAIKVAMSKELATPARPVDKEQLRQQLLQMILKREQQRRQIVKP
jgi:hypothetical protein